MRRLSLLILAPLLALGISASSAMAAEQKKVVYFQTWSAEMDTDAQSVIDESAALARDNAKSRVVVSGFASTTGSRRANQLLSELRAQVVADRLMEKGVKASRIRMESRGASHFVSTPLESRRVEVTITGR